LKQKEEQRNPAGRKEKKKIQRRGKEKREFLTGPDEGGTSVEKKKKKGPAFLRAKKGRRKNPCGAGRPSVIVQGRSRAVRKGGRPTFNSARISGGKKRENTTRKRRKGCA